MSKHTKGPWSVTYTHGKGYPGQIEADNGTLITTWGGICRKSTAEGQANAELMAAAPDLLEALIEERRIRLLGQQPDVHWESLRDARRDCYAKTDAAIAKAKGETA